MFVVHVCVCVDIMILYGKEVATVDKWSTVATSL